MKNEIMLDIAERYGTPVYVYDLQNVREQIKRLKESIGPDEWKKVRAEEGKRWLEGDRAIKGATGG